MKKFYATLTFIFLSAISLFAQTATVPSGTGTSIDPYLIETLDNLFWVTQNSSSWNKIFKQTADIDASSTSTWDSGQGFTPIGNNTTAAFSGEYDGQNHTISGLFINRSTIYYQGMFGKCFGTIYRLGLLAVNITGNRNVGGLCGQLSGHVLYCYTTGIVNGNDFNCGGLIGASVSNSLTEYSYSGATVTNLNVYQGTGGLIGTMNASTVIRCYAYGSVSGFNTVGGLVGSLQSNTFIIDCYATGSVTAAETKSGGLAGSCGGSATITNSYSTGLVTGTISSGGLTGSGSPVITNSYWDKETSGKTTSAAGIGKTTLEMQTQSTFTNWDFSNIWGINAVNNNGYPFLWVPPYTQASSITFSNIHPIEMTISWTNGNGASRAVFVKEGTGAITNPSNNTSYSASTDWAAKGTQLGASGYYCVYNGTGNTVTITGLNTETQYTVQVFEYNGVASEEIYNVETATNNPMTQSTPSGIRYITVSGAGLEDGSSWANAYNGTQLQTAIWETGVTQVWVAKGTYKPTTGANRSISFQMKNGVAIYGGFAGTESTISERVNFGNGQTNETILSGDIGTIGDNSDNTYHVFFHLSNGLDNTALLDGFTITGGNANDDSFNPNGGGMFNQYSSPSLSHCFFSENTAYFGGGLGNIICSSSFTDVTIANNTATGDGGGLYNWTSTLSFTNVIVSGNSAGNGGGMSNEISSLLLTNVTIAKNSAGINGGGLSNQSSSLIINNSIIFENTSNLFGYQIYSISGDVTLNQSCYSSAPLDIYFDQTTFSAINNNIISNPLFVDAANGDFRIYGISPCTDHANDGVNSETTDIRGSGRKLLKTDHTQTGRIDMGAYEYLEGSDPLNPCTNPTDGGVIDGIQTVCYNTEAATLASLTGPSGQTGILEYQWQSNTVSATFTFDDIIGATSNTYSPGTVTQTMWFKRLARVDCMADWSGAASSNVVQVTVRPEFTSGEVSTTGETICYNTSPATTIGNTTAASGGDNTITYSWRFSTDSYATAIDGATASTYTPAGPLTSSTSYRRYAKDNTCNTIPEVSTGTWTVTIEELAVAGTLSKTPDATYICQGDNVSASLTAGSGGNGTDELEYRTRAGSDWSLWTAYTSGTDISSSGKNSIEIRTRRMADYCADSDYTTVSWMVDSTNPLATARVGSSVTLDPTGNYTLLASDVLSSYSDAGIGVETVTINPASVSCTNLGQITLNVTVIDYCGNQTVVNPLITVTQGTTLLTPWVHANTYPSANGTADYTPCNNGGTFHITSTGKSTPTRDVFSFVSQDLCGNGTVIARLADIQNGGWAGVMMRESNESGAKAVLFKTKFYSPGVNIGYRSTTNGNMSNVNQNVPSIRWMKIQRNGNTFKVFTSYNGTSWSQKYTTTIVMANCIKAGFFTESISVDRTSNAWLDHAEVVNYLKSTEDVSYEIDQETNAFEVNFFPNPANDQITINVPDNSKTVKVMLINASGMIVESGQFNTMEYIYNLNHIKPGVYLLRFERDGVVVNKRLIVM
jgi:hypothetical protein